MASLQFSNGQVRNSRACSTTQMCLRRILRIISTFPPPGTPEPPNTKCLRGEDNRGFFDVDLNLRLSSPPPPPPLDTEQSEFPKDNGGSSTCNGSGVQQVLEIEDSSVGGCGLKAAVDLFGTDTSEIEDGVAEEEEEEEEEGLEAQRLEIGGNGDTEETTAEEDSKIKAEEVKHQVKERHRAGRLDLLIEAAKFVSGVFEDGEPETNRASRNGELSREVTETNSKRRKRSESWIADLYGDFEDVSPVVRSKRGRSQVLPYKYRDSVLEPLKPLSRHRSATVPYKRRSR